MTKAQARLLAVIRSYGDAAEYWPVINDWVNDAGPTKALALHNINRTVNALIQQRQCWIDDDGLFHLGAKPEDQV
jgi:hypothetical protein